MVTSILSCPSLSAMARAEKPISMSSETWLWRRSWMRIGSSLAALLYLVAQVVLVNGEHPVGWPDGWMGQQVVLDLVDEELQEHDDPVGFAGLRRNRHVLTVDAVVGLGDAYPSALEVEVSGCERQRLTAAHPQPVQHLEDYERDVLVHNGPGEPLVLVLGSEVHIVGLLAVHPVHLAHGVAGKVVVADGMVEHCRQLVAMVRR